MRTFCALLCLLLPGCSLVGTDFTMPEFGLEALWQPSSSTYRAEAGEVDMQWWKQLDDPALTGLIEKALLHNRDMRIALANLEQARAQRSLANAAYWPGVDTTLRAEREGLNQTTSGDGNNVVRERNNFSSTFDASWELDLFGVTGREVEAADAFAQQREAEQRDVMLAVAAEVAHNYFAARGLQAQIAVSQKNLALVQETLSLVEARFSKGMVSQLDVHRARADSQSIEATIPELQSELNAALLRLHTLTAVTPNDALPAIQPAEEVLALRDVVPVGLPSELLKRRPDVRAAAAALQQSTALVGVEEGALFPSFSLTGRATASARYFGDAFSADAISYAYGPRIEWGILYYPVIRARIAAAQAANDASLASYEKTVLLALEDVETSLVRYGKQWKSVQLYDATFQSRQEAERIAQLRYKAGEEDFLSVIDAQRSAAEARIMLVQQNTLLYTRLVQLYKALGGGWHQASTTPTKSSTSD